MTYRITFTDGSLEIQASDEAIVRDTLAILHPTRTITRIETTP